MGQSYVPQVRLRKGTRWRGIHLPYVRPHCTGSLGPKSSPGPAIGRFTALDPQIGPRQAGRGPKCPKMAENHPKQVGQQNGRPLITCRGGTLVPHSATANCQPATTNRHQLPTATNRQPPTTNHRHPPAINRQPTTRTDRPKNGPK